MQTVIAVAMHKPYTVPDAPPYLPVQAGAALYPDIGVQSDHTGESISPRNPLYCELTAHYWLWKNVTADVYGLCHYRRYFMCASRRTCYQSSLPEVAGCRRQTEGVLTLAEIEELLQTADVLVPRPRLYVIETNWSHYAHAHRESDLVHLRAVMAEQCPDYLPAFDRVMKRRWGRRFNMFIMRREAFTAYSAWLFGLLFALEARLGTEDIPPRTMGFIAERLMDVWLKKEKPRFRQLPVLHTEGQGWPRRIAAFLLRKVTGGRRGRKV